MLFLQNLVHQYQVVLLPVIAVNSDDSESEDNPTDVHQHSNSPTVRQAINF